MVNDSQTTMLVYGSSLVDPIISAPLTAPCVLAEPWCTTQTRSRHTQMPTVHHTGAQPEPCGRRSHRNRRFHREASSGPLLTCQTTSWAPRGGETCRPCRESWRKGCIWNLGCDLVQHLRNESKVTYLLWMVALQSDLEFNDSLLCIQNEHAGLKIKSEVIHLWIY